MKCKKKIVGYGIRELGGLRCWFRKRDKRGVFLNTSKGKAKVYRTERGAASRAKWLNGLVYRYADGTRYEFAVVPIVRDDRNSFSFTSWR